jgi:hypothetical protein
MHREFVAVLFFTDIIRPKLPESAHVNTAILRDRRIQLKKLVVRF